MTSKVLILGKGLVGNAIVEKFSKISNFKIYNPERLEVNLLHLDELIKYLGKVKPHILINAAGVVGGIEKNITSPFDLGIENTLINSNILYASNLMKISRLFNLVPACVYPKDISTRAKIEQLFESHMEPTSLPYSSAKLNGIVLVKACVKQHGLNWQNVIVTNTYGKNVSLDTHKSHVIPALLMKFHVAKIKYEDQIVLPGNGSAIREFIHVDDLAEALKFILLNDIQLPDTFNISGENAISIRDLVEVVKDVTKYDGRVLFSNDGKDGTSIKLIDGSDLIGLGWSPKISLKPGLNEAYQFSFS